MLKRALSNIVRSLNQFEHNIAVALGIRWPPVSPEFALVGDSVDLRRPTESFAESFLKDLREGIFWGVPKHRRSLERRKKRMYGVLERHWKLLRPKKNLLTCMHCGHWHEPHTLCPYCWRKINAETKLLSQQIVETLGLKPIEQEVVVLYKDEVNQEANQFHEGKRIVNVDRPRPSWWNKNLAEPSTQQPSDSKEIKPLDVA